MAADGQDAGGADALPTTLRGVIMKVVGIKLAVYLIMSAIVAGVLYLFGSFVSESFNISNWHYSLRMIVAALQMWAMLRMLAGFKD